MTASRFVVMVSLILALFSAPLAGDAQERPKGYVFSFTQLEGSHLWESCRQGLRELGYVEGVRTSSSSLAGRKGGMSGSQVS